MAAAGRETALVPRATARGSSPKALVTRNFGLRVERTIYPSVKMEISNVLSDLENPDGRWRRSASGGIAAGYGKGNAPDGVATSLQGQAQFSASASGRAGGDARSAPILGQSGRGIGRILPCQRSAGLLSLAPLKMMAVIGGLEPLALPMLWGLDA
jgi:hypothetical protein